jgi:LPXTG-motif cell wall-anchored protein
MQCRIPKIVALILPLLFATSTPTLSQVSNYRLQQADSLFNAKQYTQSLEHYKKIFAQDQFSPAMLLKMAFIEEGLRHIGEAMFYLNTYYHLTSDESALNKIQQLSEKFKLEGYNDPETETALSYYRQYQNYVSLALAGVMLLLFALMIFLRRKKKHPVIAFVFLLLFAVILFAHVTISETRDKAIIAKENSYLMEGPSGAAPVVEVITPGHRVSIIRRHDVWVEVEWRDKTAYIREDRLLPVLL